MSSYEFDPTVHHPELGELSRAVGADDWGTVASYAERWRDADPARLTIAAWTISDHPRAEDFLARRAGDPLGDALRAHLRVKRAWDARTRRLAKDVSPEQWRRFRALLVEAEQVLVDLAAADPGDALVASLRLTTARGLSLGRAEAERRYARLATVSPHHVPGQSAQLQTLAPKWTGSTEVMFAFARSCTETGAGTSAGRLVAEAQREHWLDLDDAEGTAFLRQPEAHEELRAAAMASVFHPDYRPGLNGVLDHSLFAMLHATAGRPQDAAVHFRALDGRADLDAWRYFGRPRAAFDEHAAAARRAGGRA